MPRCPICRKKFIAKYFNQKPCSTECRKVFEVDNPTKEINKVSEKRTKEEKIYYAKKLVYMTNNSLCECGCGKSAEDLHHKNGRVGKMLYNEFYFMAVTRKCHDWIHLNPKEAREKGWLI